MEAGSLSLYIVASVEVGNTTTKCILTATDLTTGKTFLVNKVVKLTRNVRKPRIGETIFGETIFGIPLTRQSIAEIVRECVVESCNKAGISVSDLDFCVRSTGVVAHFENPSDIGTFIQALADGTLLAGIPPSKMVPAVIKENLPEKVRRFSFLDKVFFDGSVASVLPPRGSTGAEIVANEMEGELSTAGIKEGAKWTDVDFRNPCISMDFGTTFKGRITNDDLPYARTIGNFCGLGGAIADAIVKGFLKQKDASAIDLKFESEYSITEEAIDLAEEIHKHIRVEKLAPSCRRFGKIPVNAKAAEEAGILLVGCDVGDNGSKFDELEKIGAEIEDRKLLLATIDVVMAKVFRRVLEVIHSNGFLLENIAIGITGRAGITGKKPWLILEELQDLGFFKKPEKNLVFVDDGLARGAAVMARCMNALGNPKNPLGGLRFGGCVLNERIKLQSGYFTS
ncbi:MAG: methanogenesis marker 14 protein [Archaeoglobaceae archaeon]|nr:methanogenesis marker 14 protein [Archaeoglobaceae archaeon]MDW8128562.1 methanogenesis marker 14 protein [Archaeoglobaceae archaeon]